MRLTTPTSVSSFLPRLRFFAARQWVFLLALLLYLPLTFLGYGSDVDTFRVLDAGRNFVATADYVPSRRPGYLVHELSTFALDRLGGSLAANLGTLFWAFVAAVCFRRILHRHHIPNENLLTLAFVIHPVFWYNATVTADYLWALGMLLAGFDLLERARFGWAGLALGLAVGCRISSALAAGFLLLYAWMEYPGRRRQVMGGALFAAFLASLAYVLPWDFAEWRPSFWEASTGSPELWPLAMRAGRFLYKNLYFWGLPAAFMGVIVLARLLRGPRSLRRLGSQRLVWLCLLALLGLQALFFRYPIEVEYLLPTLPFWLILAGLALPERRQVILLAVLIFSYNFVNLNLAKPDAPGQASRATLGIWLEPGYLLQESTTRLILLGCDSRSCYNERIERRPEREFEDARELSRPDFVFR